MACQSYGSGNNVKRHVFITCLKLLFVTAVIQVTIKLVLKYYTPPTIYAITPTVARLEQIADLTRLSNTLRWVPNIHWILIEDSKVKTSQIKNFLANCGIPYTHLNKETPQSKQQNITNHRGVMQRNTGLYWIRTQQFDSGVIYFVDDDNTYDIRIFEEMRYTNCVSVWPVGLAGGLKCETPIVKQGKVIGFWSVPSGRIFAIDMAGFAVNVKFFKEKLSAKFRLSARKGYLEDDFLRQLGITLNDLEPRANECTKVYVWHTKTQNTILASEILLPDQKWNKFRRIITNIEV